MITTSENLRRSREKLNLHTHTVFNAADVEIFNQALDSGLALPATLPLSQFPLGVVGMHDSRLDVEALETLARADTSWHIILIGP